MATLSTGPGSALGFSMNFHEFCKIVSAVLLLPSATVVTERYTGVSLTRGVYTPWAGTHSLRRKIPPPQRRPGGRYASYWNAFLYSNPFAIWESPPSKHIYRPQTKFAKVMFLHVCVCPLGPGNWAGTLPRDRYTPLAGTPSSGGVHAGRYGTQAGGMNPTGMHSSFFLNI